MESINSNILKVSKYKCVFMCLLYAVHGALIRRRSGEESKWYIEPFEMAELS
jgi:hypothetical protein